MAFRSPRLAFTLAIFLRLAFAVSTSATPLAVHLTAGFTNQKFTITYTDGSYDKIKVSATVDLVFSPSTPACDDPNFKSSSAGVSGTIHVWGSATNFDPNPDLIENFDNTYNYSGGPLAVPTTYEGQTGQAGVQSLAWQIATTRSQNNALPYRVEYDGPSHRLRLWVSLPSPFWYIFDDEYYDTTGTTVVSGQASVPSCLNGIVTDAGTGKPISGAHVSFGNNPSTTDGSGAFHYGGIPANPYLLIVTNAGYYAYTNRLTIPAFTIVKTTVPLNLRVPVILVHGWRGSPDTWSALVSLLAKSGIEYSVIDYRPATGDPRAYAQKFASAIDNYRKTGYTGKVDVVCHSMGALVSRWYMERLGGGDNVRQWIGIAPVNQGAALADFEIGLGPLAWITGVKIQDLRGDGAITQMRTDSDTVTQLNQLGRAPGVIYRIIAGYNGCALVPNCSNPTPAFNPPFLSGGKTYARIIDERGVVHSHALTYFGDAIVALVQSQLSGSASTDCFINLGHNDLPGNVDVIAQVVKYLLDPAAQSLNNCPTTADLLRDTDVETVGVGNQGFLSTGRQQIQNFTVDGSVQKLSAQVIYNGSQLAMTLFSPTGTMLVPGVYPVIEYSNAVNSVWYVIDAPAPGDWTARIDALDVPTNGEPYDFQALFSSPLELEVSASNGLQPLHTGQPVSVWANFHNGTNAITGASVAAQMVNSVGETNSLAFYDDGTHGDTTPGDGIYASSFSPGLAGLYRLAVTAKAGLVQRVETLNLKVESPQIRPTLTVLRSGGSVVLSWTAEPGAFLLEGNGSLARAEWFAENTIPQIASNNLQTVTLSVTNTRYFRLRGR